MADRTRIRQPLLPVLVQHLESRHERLAGLLVGSTGAPIAASVHREGSGVRHPVGRAEDRGVCLIEEPLTCVAVHMDVVPSRQAHGVIGHVVDGVPGGRIGGVFKLDRGPGALEGGDVRSDGPAPVPLVLAVGPPPRWSKALRTVSAACKNWMYTSHDGSYDLFPGKPLDRCPTW
jgi:hypothetical protein